MTQAVHPIDLAVELHELALACRNAGRYEQAEAFARESLRLLEREVGPHHPDVANVLDGLASLRGDLGAFDEALELSRRALEILDRVPHGGAVVARLRAQVAAHLADVYRALGQGGEAEAVLRQELALAEAALGRDDLDVGVLLNELAKLYGGEGRSAEAALLYRRALAIFEAALGAEHPRAVACRAGFVESRQERDLASAGA
ncbi:MAG TPA: tetratricopeptide repeat protein [Thermoanaerobaculia bacterium]|jgi:tetratricopeptide (TPR) repeat protein